MRSAVLMDSLVTLWFVVGLGIGVCGLDFFGAVSRIQGLVDSGSG